MRRDRSRARWGREPSRRRAAVGFWVTAATYGLVMMGGTLPIPLYELWALEMHFGAFGTTEIFAVYAIGVLVSLLVFGSLSDQLGRRPVLVASLVVLALSTALFLVATSLAWLLAARFVFGLAAGAVTTTANAALAELARPDRPKAAAVMSTVANMGGLGLGSVASGAVARFTGDPTHEVFWWYLIVLGIAVVAAVLTVPETVVRRTAFRLDLRRPLLPGSAGRRSFLGALALVFAAFAVNGAFSSLVPAFVRHQLGVEDSLAAAALVSIVFFAALLAQLLPAPRWFSGLLVGPGALILGVLVVEAGLLAGSMATFITGTVIAGAGVGLVFGRGIALTQRLADPDHRAGLTATYFLAAYAGTTVPTLVLGALDQALGTTPSTLILFGAIAGIAVGGTVFLSHNPPQLRTGH